jgi:TorA maturation chaperone TorD
MEVLIVIAVVWLVGWLLVREKKEDRLVREVREAEQKKTAEVRRVDEERQAAERRTQQAKEQAAREEIYRIRNALEVPCMQTKADFSKLFAGEELDRAVRAWSSYMFQSRAGPHKNKFKFAKVERFGNPATVEEARMAAERVQIAARIAVIQKLTKRGAH